MECILTIDKSQDGRVEEAFAGLYKIPLINNPNFDPKKEVGPENEKQIPKYTKKDWVKECIRTWAARQVARYDQMRSVHSIQCNVDDTLIS
jgi:hypothetical protein